MKEPAPAPAPAQCQSLVPELFTVHRQPPLAIDQAYDTHTAYQLAAQSRFR